MIYYRRSLKKKENRAESLELEKSSSGVVPLPNVHLTGTAGTRTTGTRTTVGYVLVCAYFSLLTSLDLLSCEAPVPDSLPAPDSYLAQLSKFSVRDMRFHILLRQRRL